VTFGTPSGRIGRVPTYLKRLTESVTIVESFTVSSLSLIVSPAGRVAQRASDGKGEGRQRP
jgi:hypothetical protein